LSFLDTVQVDVILGLIVAMICVFSVTVLVMFDYYISHLIAFLQLWLLVLQNCETLHGLALLFLYTVQVDIV